MSIKSPDGQIVSFPSIIEAPSSLYNSSGISAETPAPASTCTSYPSLVKAATFSGAIATLLSSAVDSLGITMIMGKRTDS